MLSNPSFSTNNQGPPICAIAQLLASHLGSILGGEIAGWGAHLFAERQAKHAANDHHRQVCHCTVSAGAPVGFGFDRPSALR